MLEATLNQEVAKTVDHQWIGLRNNCLNNFVLLLCGTDLELLLQKDRSLLIIVAHNLIDDVLPIAIDSTIKKAAVVQRFGGWQVGLSLCRSALSHG